MDTLVQNENKAEARLVSGRIWEEFCETLRVAGRVIDQFDDDVGLDENDRAEWYRYLTRVMRWGLTRYVENIDPGRPKFIPFEWRISINVTTPDQDHWWFDDFDPEAEYRITGSRGSVPYFVICALSTKKPANFVDQEWASRGLEGLTEYDQSIVHTTAFLQSQDLIYDEDGNFEVIVSQKRHPGNWLQIQPDSTWIINRVVRHHRAKEMEPVLKIERLNPVPIARTTPRNVAQTLLETAQLVLGYANLVRHWWQDDLGKRINRLRFSKSLYLTNGGVNDREFAFGAWKKPKDHALVFQFTPPECEYWILQFCNIWQENLDNYEEGQGRINKFTAKYESDGSILAVFAEENPSIGGSWIDSGGWTKGIMGLRFINTMGIAEVKTYLVPLDELKLTGREALTDDRAVTSGERAD